MAWYESALLIYILVIAVVIMGYIGSQARKIGYSPWIWAFVALTAGPAFTFGLIAGLTDRKVRAARRRERDLLAAQLDDARRRGGSTPIPRRTIGDMETVDTDL